MSHCVLLSAAARRRFSDIALVLITGVIVAVPSSAKVTSFADAITRAGNLQGRIMWCDAEANQEYLSSRENVAEVMRQCKDSGINTVVVDVKPLSGYVLYKSKIAPRLAARANSSYPKDYDLLKEMVDEGHKQGLKVHAAINVFSEGSEKIGSGTAFDHPDWQCVNYETTSILRNASGAEFAFSGTDAPMEEGQLRLFTSDLTTCLNNTAVARAVIDEMGAITAKYAPGESIGSYVAPLGLRVLAGSGPAAEWIVANLSVGEEVDIGTRPKFVPVSESSDQHMAVFVNPANRAVRDYELSIIKEIAGNYDIDGLILDRMRYPGIYADFSDLSREKFEKWLGSKVERWPEDVLRRPAQGSFERGKRYTQWLEWRAHQIKEFLSEAKSVLRNAKPSAKLGVYVGSWYSEYYDVGVNWGSPNYIPGLDWTSETYNTAGYANLVDYMCTGCYYPFATREEAKAQGKPEWSSVEAAAQGSNEAVMDDTFVYASVYLLDYNNKPDRFVKAVQTCLSSSQGVMLFDLVYVRKYGWWPLLKQALGEAVRAPHDVPNLLHKVQEVRKVVKTEAEN